MGSQEVVDEQHTGRIRAALPEIASWPARPGGWPDQIEAALIDAIFSSNARYGGPESGVRQVVRRWQERVHPRRADDLTKLVSVPYAELARVLKNRQRVPGRSPDRPRKADAVLDAARRLHVELGVRTAAEMISADASDGETSQEVFTRGYGLGPVTYSYFLMLLGTSGIKADRMIRGFLQRVVGLRDVGAEEA